MFAAGRGAVGWLGAAALMPSLLVALPARAATQCTPPRCMDVVDVAVPVPSELNITVPDNHVRIILPVGYSSSGPGYPVIYLLHGAGDTYQTWSQNTDGS